MNVGRAIADALTNFTMSAPGFSITKLWAIAAFGMVLVVFNTMRRRSPGFAVMADGWKRMLSVPVMLITRGADFEAACSAPRPNGRASVSSAVTARVPLRCRTMNLRPYEGRNERAGRPLKGQWTYHGQIRGFFPAILPSTTDTGARARELFPVGEEYSGG